MALLGVCVALAANALSPTSLVAGQLSYFLVAFVLIIPVHELGHASAGALVGFRITNIIIGTGPQLAAFRFLGVAVQIKLLPFGGLTMATPREAHRSMRFRHWILTAGGPAANVLIYLALRRVFGAVLGAEHHPLAATAIWANWTVLILNLIPFRTSEGAASDGYGLFTIPFWSAMQLDEARLRSYGMLIYEALNRDDVPTARRWADEARTRHPESPLAYTYAGVLLHREHRHDEAIVAWREGLIRTADPKQAALLKNNIAFAQVVRGDPEDLPEADRLSTEAFALLPELPAVRGTRGSVLLRLGRAADALPLLVAGEAGALGNRNKAYNGASIASALAALGRHDEAVLKLEEARRADAACEFLARAESDIAAGPLPAAAAPTPTATVDPVAQADLLRRWRRDARILAFVSMVVVTERLGLSTVLAVAAIVVSLAPDLSGAYALAGFGLSAALLRAAGLNDHQRFSIATGGRAETALVAFAMGVAACWLVARHRRIGQPPRSRTPAVLGWLMFSLIVLTMLPDLLGLGWDHSSLAFHASARSCLGEAPGLIGLAALMLSRPRRDVRRLAAIPVLVVLLAIVPGSSLFLNYVALGDIPEQGASVTFSKPIAAKIVRSTRIAARGDSPTLCPNGRAFFVEDFEPHVAPGDKARTRFVLHVGDFAGHVVDVEGTTGAFLDDERLLVLRPGRDPDDDDQLAEIRPFGGGDPVWTKPVAGIDIRQSRIRIDHDSGIVFVVAASHGDDGAPAILRTTAAPNTRVEAGPLKLLDGDNLIAVAPRPRDWGGILISRGTRRRTAELLWRTTRGEQRLASRPGRLECAEPLAGADHLWCFISSVPVLLRLDIEGPAHLTRIPGELENWQSRMLRPDLMAILKGSELTVVDLSRARGVSVTLPEDRRQGSLELSDGGFATLQRTERHGIGTVTVYEAPAIE